VVDHPPAIERRPAPVAQSSSDAIAVFARYLSAEHRGNHQLVETINSEDKMVGAAGGTTSSSEVIPAGHAALSADEEAGPPPKAGLAGLAIAALDVVFGDIGTSPVYTFRECFNPEHGLPLSPENVVGVLSLIVWALILSWPASMSC
jgi:hypothetical protein